MKTQSIIKMKRLVPFVCMLALLCQTPTDLHAQFKSVKGTRSASAQTPQLSPSDISQLTRLYHPEVTTSPQTPALATNLFKQDNILKARLRVVAFNDENMPAAISGVIPDKDRNKDLLVKALDYLHTASSLTHIQDPDTELQLLSRTEDELGQTHFRFAQNYQGVPIYGSEVLVHADRGQINYINGKWKKSLEDFDTNASLSLDEVLGQVILQEKLQTAIDPFSVMGDMNPKINLVIYYTEGQPILAYHVTGYPDKLHRWEYFIDAHSGQQITKYMNSCQFHNHNHFGSDEIGSAAPVTEPESPTPLESNLLDGAVEMNGTDLFNRTVKLNCVDVAGTRYMIDAVRPMFKASSSLPNDPEGTIWTIDAFNTSPQKDNFNYDHVKTTAGSWTNKQAAVSAHFNGAQAYVYYKDVHGRNSINGSGGNIVSLVNVADEDGKTMGNAFWNGAAMFYGNGDSGFQSLARGLDVAGHEMTHGVVQNTANLEYQGESGALNESFADVFGMLIDREDWKIGEDVVKTGAFPSGALRDLSDPHNGAAQNDYGSGFQPKHYNERYTGSQDNGGVHINSGIPNHAFFLFASNAAVGLDRAEKVYYRALSQYLTKSSKFTDARLAVVKAATDLFGTNVANAAAAAFDAVGVAGGGNGGNTDPGDQYQTDLEINPGLDLILLSNGDQSDIYMVNTQIQLIFEPKLSDTDPLSKPSVTDDGTEIVFIGQDKKFHNITINYQTGQAQEQILLNDFDFRNVVISKDGRRLAMLFDDLTPEVLVVDLGISASKIFELKNPTTAQGISTGDVQYADALEFDHSGEFLMYDAFNSLKSPTAGEITYWDISFIKVWEINTNQFQPDSEEYYDKLFSGLPEGVNVGNPTFAKNSPYIVAFDYLDDQDNYVLGANIETGDVQILANTFDLGFPTYSKDDKYVLFDAPSVLNDTKIKYVQLNADKITSVNANGTDLVDDAKWAVWFSNGQRILTGLQNQKDGLTLALSPNPVQNILSVSADLKSAEAINFKIYDVSGKLLLQKMENGQSGNNTWTFDVVNLPAGSYTLTLSFADKMQSKRFIKH